MIKIKSKKDLNISNEIKNLKIDNSRKENIIRELKNNLEIYKNKEKKKEEGKENYTEKIKKLTNDINLKDAIIKDLKERYELLLNNNSNILEMSTKNNKITNINNAEQKKLKNDIQKKEQLIKALKNKNFSLSMELKEIQTHKIRQNKNNINELIKEQQLHSKTKIRLDDYQITLEKMANCLRKIFTDLFTKYEKEQKKKNEINIPQSMHEGIEILGLDEYEVGLMFNPENDNNFMLNQIHESLKDLNNFDGDNIMQIYFKLINGVENYNNNEANNNYSFK